MANPLMNGAYIGSKTIEDMKLLIDSAAGAIVVGSISVKPRLANKGQRYWQHKGGMYALNSFGMPNRGMPYFEKALPKIVKMAHVKNKLVIANVVGFSKQEFVELIQLAERSGADIVELNFGCPNVWEKGQQKQILSYNPDLVREYLEFIRNTKPKIKIAVKISPLPPDALKALAVVMAESGVVDIVTATNSYPNTASSAGTNSHSADLAGLTGRALKPISLGVVKQLRDLLPKNIAIIGCGGISSVDDVRDYIKAGAEAVQVVTGLLDHGPAIFSKINQQI